MRRWMMASLCHQGILGGALWFDENELVFRTGKAMLPPEWRCIRMPYREITAVERGRGKPFCTVTLQMQDGRRYKLLIFTPGAFFRDLQAHGVG